MSKRKTTRRREPTDADILRAREILEYSHPYNLTRNQQVGLVAIYYPGGIRGDRVSARLPADQLVPLSELSESQLYRIAEERYNHACRIHENPTSHEKLIVGRINQIKAEQDSDRRYELAERLCIELASEPDNSYLGKMLSRALGRRTS